MPTGPGIVAPQADIVHIVGAALIAAAVIAIGLIVYRRPRRTIAVSATLAVVSAVLIGSLLYAHPAPTFGNMMGVPVGASSDSSSDGELVIVGPRAPFVALVEIVNNGALPLKVLGVVKPFGVFPATFPDWQSVVVYRDGEAAAAYPAGAQPFVPFDLGPGDHAVLVLNGMTDGCASTDTSADSSSGIRAVPLAYELFGLRGQTDIELFRGILQPREPGCALL